MNPASKKRTVLFLAAVFAIIAICAASVMTWQYRSYCDKMEIAYTLAGAEAVKADTDDIRYDSPVLAAAADMLKGNGADEENTESGRELLMAYGYGIPAGEKSRRIPDAYQRDLYRSWAVTAGISAAVFLAIAVLFLFFMRKAVRQQEKELLSIAGILSELQSGDYDAPMCRHLAERKGAGGILDDRLESLAEHLSYIRTASEKEKESTKSLVTDLSHQLKTPVAAMGTSLEVLRQEDLTEEERREFTERCLKQEERLKDLLGALINISRLESGMIELKFTEARLMDTDVYKRQVFDIFLLS